MKHVTHNMEQKNKKPLVSVVMPVYNAKAYIREAVESILAQTYTNIEFIIIDDCSTDGSQVILEEYKSKFPDIINLIRTKKNLNSGGDACANVGMKRARGKYIARMDADDIAVSTRIEKQIAFLEERTDILMVGSQAIVIDADRKVIGVKREPLTSKEIFKAYFTYHPIIHPSIMIRRIIDGSPFMYKLKYSANNDYLTFFGLLCNGYKFANLPEELINYRIHGKNDTFTHIKQKFMNTYQIRQTMVNRYGYEPTLQAWILNIVQFIIMKVLPESVISKLYLLSKGIVKVRIQAPQFAPLKKGYASLARSVANFL